MKFDPKAVPFWEQGRGGPISERVKAHEIAEEKQRERRKQLAKIEGRLTIRKAVSHGA